MADKEITDGINKQAKNMEQFKDVFEKIDFVSNLNFPSEAEQQGARKACMLIANYLLNRKL